MEAQRLQAERNEKSNSTLEVKTPTTTLNVEMKSTGTECGKPMSLDPTMAPPTIVMSSVTPPVVSPMTGSSLPLPGMSASGGSSPVGTPNLNNTPTHPLLTTRRDSTTQVICHKVSILYVSCLKLFSRRQSRLTPSSHSICSFKCYYKGKEASPSKLARLTRQAAAIDESLPPPGRRGSQPTLSPDPDDGGKTKEFKDYCHKNAD